ncbi:MAG: TonB-dependent receptor plug domain-containing protein, partial [Bacteroidota bacterium]
ESEYTYDIELNFKEEEAVVIETEGIPTRAEEMTSSMDVVKPQSVNSMAATDITNALQNVPGLTLYDDQPSIRGSSGYTYGVGSRVLTLLNGLPMISANRSAVSFDMLPTDNIKQIEIFKGAASVLYGAGAMGGVINVITDDPADTARTVIRAATSIYDSPANDTADFDGRSAAVAPSIHFFHSRKLGNFDFTTQLDLINESGYRKDEFQRRLRALVMTKYHIPVANDNIKEMYFGLNAQASIDSSASMLGFAQYPETGLVAGDGLLSRQMLYRYSIDPSFFISTRRHQVTLQHRSYLQEDLIDTGQSGVSNLFYTDLKHQFKVTESFGFVWGGSHIRNNVIADSTFGRPYSDQYGAFAQLQAKIGDRINLVGGVRYTIEDVTGDTTVTREGGNVTLRTINRPIFRAGINYRPAQGTFLRGSWGQAVRSPSIAERFTTTAAGPIVVAPAPEIEVEEGWTAEIGARQLFQIGRKVRGFADVSFFMMDFTNMVEFYVDEDRLINTGNIAFVAQNVSDAQVQGVELNTAIQVEASESVGLNLSGGVTFTNPIDEDGDEALDGDDSLSLFIGEITECLLGPCDGIPSDRPRFLKYRSRWMARTSAELSYKRWSLMTNFRYTSRIENVDYIFLSVGILDILENSAKFRETKNQNGWTEFDFILSYNLPRTTFSFGIYNAFNTEFMTIPGTLGEQRRFALQMRFDI